MIYDILAQLDTIESITDIIGFHNINAISMSEHDEYPAVIYQVIDTQRTSTLLGHNNLTGARVQFNCLAATYVVAAEIANEMRLAMDNKMLVTWGDTYIHSIILEDQADLDYTNTLEAQNIFGVRLDFLVWFDEC